MKPTEVQIGQPVLYINKPLDMVERAVVGWPASTKLPVVVVGISQILDVADNTIHRCFIVTDALGSIKEAHIEDLEPLEDWSKAPVPVPQHLAEKLDEIVNRCSIALGKDWWGV